MHASQFSGQEFAHSHSFGVKHTKQELTGFTAVRFNARNIDKRSIDNFLAGMNYKAVCDLVEQMCDQARNVRPGDCNARKLRMLFERHGIEYSHSGHDGIKSKKARAVMNLMLSLQTDSSQKAREDGKPLYERFCALLQDAHSVFTGGQELLITEIGKSVTASACPPGGDSIPEAVAGALCPEASAPPAYDTVQEQDIVTRLVNINHHIAELLNANPTLDFNDPRFLDSMNWLQTEIGLISCQTNLNDFLRNQFQRAESGLQELQKNQQAFRERKVIEKGNEKLNELEKSLKDTVKNAENTVKINEIEHELERLVNQFINDLVIHDGGKRDLQSRVRVLENHISFWKASVVAGDRLTCLAGEIDAISTRTSSQDLEAISDKLSELKGNLNDLPSDEFRTGLLRQWERVHEQFTKAVAEMQRPLPCPGSLSSAEFIKQADALIVQIESRLRGAEQNRHAVPNAPLNATHMGEVASYLHQLSELTIKLGIEYRAERERLQSQHAELYARLHQLQQGIMGSNAEQGSPETPSSEVEEAAVKSCAERINSDINNYAGRVSGEGVKAVLGALSSLLGDLSQTAAGPLATASVELSNTTTRAAVELTKLATSLNMSRAHFYQDQYINTSVGLDVTPNRGYKIVPVLLATSLSHEELPNFLKHRLAQACFGKYPQTVSLIQVFMIADSQRAFDGASFKIFLDSQMRAKYGELFNQQTARQYSPVGMTLSLPECLVQGGPFFKSLWSLHENGDANDVVNLSYDRSAGAVRQDIGLIQLQPIINAAGGDDALASSVEAGMALPFGVQICRQSDQVTSYLRQALRNSRDEIVNHSTPIHRGFPTDATVGGNFFRGGDMEAEGTDPVDSGTVPIALAAKTVVRSSQRERAKTVLVNGAGIVNVRTVAGIDVRNARELHDWLFNKVSDLENSGGLNKISVL